jgi:hypothetical protein
MGVADLLYFVQCGCLHLIPELTSVKREQIEELLRVDCIAG